MSIDLTLSGARVLGANGWQDALHIADGRVVDTPRAKTVRLDGWLVLPGIIDAHGDGFERHVAPRRGALRDMASGLQSVEAELAANGITTAMLAQFWSWEGGMRGPEAATRLCAGLAEHQTLGTDMRVQLRLEANMLDSYAEAEALIARHAIRYVVFNDHLPHAALAAGKRPKRLTGQALKAGVNPEKYLARMQDLHARRGEVPAAQAALAARLAAREITLGSHDDSAPDARRAARKIGLSVSEFPETLDTAAEARVGGDRVVMGAPNVMRGASHEGKVSARDVIAAGLCDALASDYHYPAPRHAAAYLAAGMGWAAAWALLSEGPARVLGLSDRGTLAPGLRADAVVVHPDTAQIGATIAGGRITHMTGAVAVALLAA